MRRMPEKGVLLRILANLSNLGLTLYSFDYFIIPIIFYVAKLYKIFIDE